MLSRKHLLVVAAALALLACPKALAEDTNVQDTYEPGADTESSNKKPTTTNVTTKGTSKSTSTSSHVISEDLAPLLKAAFTQMAAGDYAPAVKTLNKAVKTDDQSITAHRYRAYALVNANKPRQAITELNLIVKKLDKKPTYWEWCTFGEAYLAAGGYKQAENCFQLALKQTPTNPLARSGLIRVNVKTHNYNDALDLAKAGMKSARSNETYEYFKDLYSGVFAMQSRSGRPAQLAPPPVASNPTKSATRTAAPKPKRVSDSDKRAALERMRRNQAMFKKVVPTGRSSGRLHE